MDRTLLETLPLVQRLALSYAPAAAFEPTAALLALDTRLAGIVRTRGEPVIAQLKLAWWRERFAQEPDHWPLGEPLLALLRASGLATGRLAPLVDGWEALLAERLDEAALMQFAQGRAEGWLAVAERTDGEADAGAVRMAAEGWALADLALHLGDGAEAEMVRQAALSLPPAERMPRRLRPLAVLAGLSRRALERGASDPLDGPGAMMVAMRLGIAGR
ncbi:hypothetical protein [Aurantiacibacter luteus]|uniref:Phytoene synthase n=1 Tax=Aurantiacibacter luteus TaxID=1581420 RepID=A0A0G9MXH1_9SPHN|nr:hypothetical protein [Aurantiacibacter luteus]KLE35487.1 hypothetical protein AAW00_03415 [Aurantiacibacter luteus]